MSQFSEAFAPAFAVSTTVFGEPCTIGGRSYTCVAHELSLTAGVVPGRPGQVQTAGGTIFVTHEVWAACYGKKGSHVTVGGGTFRVMNDPQISPSSDTVKLELGSLT
jgi:hypothetical protein